jgi:hypothetical protein
MNVVYLILYMFSCLLDKKEICSEQKITKKKISLSLHTRIFDVWGVSEFEYINSICKTGIDVFEDFECRFSDFLDMEIMAYTLLFFLKNDIDWNDGCYLYDSSTDKYYYPTPNSLIFTNNILLWKGNKKINVIIGKLYN